MIMRPLMIIQSQLPDQTIQEVTARTEGYLHSFVDEGTPMADLLCILWQEQRQTGPTPYLGTRLAPFAKESKRPKRLLNQSRPRRLP